MQNNYRKFVNYLKKNLLKLKPRFSFHYVAYTTLVFLVVFSIVQLVSATTPNPGHPWSELGDGVFSFTNGQTVTPYTYTFPAVNTTVLTTNSAITVGQGGTGLNSISDKTLLVTNGANSLTTLTIPAGQSIRRNAGDTAFEAFIPGTGTVTSISVTTANGISGSSSGGATPALTLSLGAITPTSVNSIVLSGSATPTLSVTGTSAISGTNTGDQTKIANLIGGNSTTLFGAIPYQSNIDTTSLLSPNTTTTKNFLSMTGSGINGAAPIWSTIVNGDIPSALTGKTYNSLSFTSASTGFTIAGGTTSKTLTLNNTIALSGTDSSTLNISSGGTLGTAAFTASTAYQTANTNLSSLAGLSYASSSFVKMTGANTFSLDTNTYATLTGSEALTNKSVNGVTLSTSAGASVFLAGDGTYKIAGGGGSSLNGITAATADSTINSGNNGITWNWALTTAAKTAFTFGENTASTNGVGDQSIVDIKNLSGSTASPLRVVSNSSTDIRFYLNSEGDFVVSDRNNVQTFKVDSRSFTQIGTGSGSASPALLVLDTGNTASDPSGSNGGMYYNSSYNQFRCYRNSAWESCGEYQDHLNFSSMYGTSSVPTLPSSGELRLFARNVAGRMLPAFVGPAGLDSSLQPIIGRNSVAFFRAYPGAATITGVGMSPSAVGTATAKAALATTNIYTSTAGIEFLVTTAATTAVAGFRVGTTTATMPYWRGNASGMGGFTVISRFGPATGTTLTTDRMFVGMQSGTSAPTDVNPSTLTNIIGVGYDSTDTSWQIMFNDGSGTATKVNTGIAVPTADRTNLYEVAIFCAPNSSSITVQFTNLTPGGATYQSTNSVDIPTNTTFLGIRGYHSVGGTSSVVGFGLASIYSETDT